MEWQNPGVRTTFLWEKVLKVRVPFMVKIQKLGRFRVGRVEILFPKETKSQQSWILAWLKLKSWESSKLGFFFRIKFMKLELMKWLSIKVKARLKLAKAPNSALTLKVGLAFFCLCLHQLLVKSSLVQCTSCQLVCGTYQLNVNKAHPWLHRLGGFLW